MEKQWFVFGEEGERIEKEFSGRWVVKDSLLCQFYDKDTLEYKISKIQGRNVFHINGFEETVKCKFNGFHKTIYISFLLKIPMGGQE